MKWILVLAITLVVAAVGSVSLYRRSTPPVPGEFYTPPNPLPAGNAGTVIRREKITKHLPKGAVAWRVMYLSTGLRDEPVAVTGVIVAPSDNGTFARPVIAWAHGTYGILPQCGSSHRSNPLEFISAVDLLIREGFVVAATDYPGRGTPGIHPYLVGIVEAHSVLDSVRAARSLGVNAGDRFAVWGASQGGQAALWAGQTAPAYVPDLTMVGVAAQAAAIDLPGILRTTRDTNVGGVLLPEALYAWSIAYPEARLDTIIQPSRRREFERIAQTCLSTPLAALKLGRITPPSEFLLSDPDTTEPWRTIVNENIPRGRIAAPLLITHGTADMVVPIEGSVNEVVRRCAEGETVLFMRFPGVSHPGSDDTATATLGWLEDRFEQRPAASSCGTNVATRR